MKWNVSEKNLLELNRVSLKWWGVPRQSGCTPCSLWIMIHCPHCSRRANDRGKWFVKEIHDSESLDVWIWEESAGVILQRVSPNRSGCTLCCPRRLIDCPRRSCRSSERGELFEREIHFPNHELKYFRDESAAVDQRLTKVAGRSAQKCPDSSPCSSWIMIHCTRCSWRANNRGKWFVREIQILNPWMLWFWGESSGVFLRRRYPLSVIG